MKPTLYHNPRCSKSRAALALLTERGIDIAIIEYCKTPPDRRTLMALIAQLGEDPLALVRTTDRGFRDSDYARVELTTERVVQILLEHPEWMQRPVLANGSHARIGRPPERVLEIL